MQACKEHNITIQIAPNQRKIKRIGKNGEEKVYNSVSEAARDFPDKDFETARKNISRGLNQHKIAYNYYWIDI